MSDLKEFVVTDFADILNAKRIPLSSMERSKRRGIYPYYGASGIIDSVDSYLFEGEHLLVSEDGENLKSRQTPIAFLANGKFWVNNHAHILRGKKEFHNKLLCYYLESLDLHPFLTGAVQPKLNKASLTSIPIYLPENEDEQSNIVSILSSLDDKIDLLQRQNATLEAMAETLFRQWFVEEAKEEWEEGKISDFGEVITGKTPSKENSNYWGDKFDFVTPTDFKDFGMFANNTARSLSELGWSKMKSLQIPEQSILVTCIGSDMGKVAISSKKCITNQQLNTVIVKNEKHLGFLFEYIKSQYQNIRNIAFGGTTMPIINKTDFSNIPIPIPPDETIELFNNHWKPLSNKILKNQTQIRTLATLRDTLLPKLMSGEVRVVE